MNNLDKEIRKKVCDLIDAEGVCGRIRSEIAAMQEWGKLVYEANETELSLRLKKGWALIKDLEGAYGKTLPVEFIKKDFFQAGFSPAETDEMILHWRMDGDLFEPRAGYVARV